MSTSITGSTVSPYTGLLLQDANFNVSSSFPAAGATTTTTAINFPNLDYPTTGKFLVQVYNTAITGTANSLTVSMSLQHSSDGVTFVAIPAFGTTLLGATDNGGSIAAGSIQVSLPPDTKPYVRAWASVPSTMGTLTGYFGITTLF